MAAYPVTVAQFQAFALAKDVYADARWWQDLHKNSPEKAWQATRPNHPVTDVSWFDATAYCRWLSDHAGYEVRLPDEPEWQWAAQSAQSHFRYPWGATWQEGVAIAALDINGAGLQALSDQLSQRQRRCAWSVADVTNADELK